MKKVLFIDRDGTLIVEPEDEQIDSLEKLFFLPFAISGLKQVLELGFTLVMVSNQDGLGTDAYPFKDFDLVQNKLLAILRSENIVFDEIFIDHHFPQDKHPNRKPGIGMLENYLKTESIQLSSSYVIGDRFSDVEFAKNIGCNAIWFGDHPTDRIDNNKVYPFVKLKHWNEVINFLKPINILPSRPTREAIIHRETNETIIDVALNLDGIGLYEIKTGIHFYDHMLEQFARHSGINLNLLVKGDLEIDEHHTIEDSAIVLGQAFKKAMGGKIGMERYGFLLPMDEALVQCALDFSGRSYFIFKGVFDREYVGDFPTEMVEHWFKSFCDASGLNLNLQIVEGMNTHHKIEACFKTFARCIKQAIRIDGEQLASTKGLL